MKFCPSRESPRPLMWARSLSLLLPFSNCLATLLFPAAAWAPSPRKVSLLIRHRRPDEGGGEIFPDLGDNDPQLLV